MIIRIPVKYFEVFMYNEIKENQQFWMILMNNEWYIVHDEILPHPLFALETFLNNYLLKEKIRKLSFFSLEILVVDD
jgi:hypothetical protein